MVLAVLDPDGDAELREVRAPEHARAAGRDLAGHQVIGETGVVALALHAGGAGEEQGRPAQGRQARGEEREVGGGRPGDIDVLADDREEGVATLARHVDVVAGDAESVQASGDARHPTQPGGLKPDPEGRLERTSSSPRHRRRPARRGPHPCRRPRPVRARPGRRIEGSCVCPSGSSSILPPETEQRSSGMHVPACTARPGLTPARRGAARPARRPSPTGSFAARGGLPSS